MKTWRVGDKVQRLGVGPVGEVVWIDPVSGDLSVDWSVGIPTMTLVSKLAVRDATMPKA